MTTHQGAHAVGSDRADPVKADSQALAEEQQYRAEAYRLIAALLRSAPDAPLLEKISGLSEVAAPDELGISLSMLGLAARSFDQRAAAEEFHQLFIGLGRGELVPYASWYLTGFLMEKPLGELREHLKPVKHYVYMGPRDEEVAEQLPGVLFYDELLAAEPDDYQWPELDERLPSSLCYTSGTTGNP